MFISGMSGNEIYCLGLKGLAPGEITVGNSVYAMGVGASLGALGRSLSGGEITQITSLISDGRHGNTLVSFGLASAATTRIAVSSP